MMTNPQISPARKADLITLNEISFAAKAHWNYPQEWLELWREGLKLKETDLTEMQIFKLVEENVILGFCAMKTEAAFYEVEHLWIKPTFIGKGYGRFLLNKTLEKVVQKSLPIKVLSDPNAEAFYARQGFVTFDQKESTPKGRFLPLMQKH